MKLVNSEL